MTVFPRDTGKNTGWSIVSRMLRPKTFRISRKKKLRGENRKPCHRRGASLSWWRRQNAAIGIVTSGLPPPSPRWLLVLHPRPTTTYYGGITMPRPLLGCTFISNLHQLLRSSFLHLSLSEPFSRPPLLSTQILSNPMLKSIEESILEISIKRNAKRKESLDPRKGSEYAIRRLLFSFFFFFSSKFNHPNRGRISQTV